jgi:hypothetical protein
MQPNVSELGVRRRLWRPALIQAATAINLGNLMRSYAAIVSVTLPHPNGSSTRLRFCWLTSYPQ